MKAAAWDLFAELKGYVDGIIDAYPNIDGIPYSAMENVQKRIEAIHVLECRGDQ